MAKDLFALARDMGRLVNELPKRTEKMTNQAAIGTLDTMIRITPVDTSKAESNWQVAVGAEFLGPIPAHVLGQRGSSRAASGAIAAALGREKIEGRLYGQQIHVTNVVEYIDDLDKGASPQLSGGFARRADMAIRSFIDGYKLL